jgi:signal peptidase I
MAGFTRFLVWAILILGALGGFLYFAFFDVWKVPADDPQFAVSVEPTLSAGDLVLVARHGNPGEGNLVRCTDPDEPRRWIVGRWTAGGRDKVEFTGEAVSVNGWRASSPRGCAKGEVTLTNPASGNQEALACRQVEFAGLTHETLVSTQHAEGSRSMTVDPGKIFLVSDNRHMHLDSRDFGSIDPALCQHVLFRLWGDSGFSDARHRLTFIW